MFSHPLAKEAEKWFFDHGGKHSDPAWLNFLSDFSYLSKRKVDEHTREHSNAGRFGMSKAGGCTRAQALKLMGEVPEPFSGSTRVTFQIGHMIEVLGLATLRALGLALSASTEDEVQWEARIDPFMLSYSDGVILPNEKWPVRTIVSIKSAGMKMSGRTKDGWKRYGFAQYPMDGLRRTNPNYWAQLQAEMLGTETRQALFFLVAKDMIAAMKEDPILAEQNGSLSFYAEVVEIDEKFCNEELVPLWSKVWGQVKSKTDPIARVLSRDGGYVTLNPFDGKGNKERTSLYNVCDYCDLRQPCEVRIARQLEKENAVTSAR
jgi:hypothetical protein